MSRTNSTNVHAKDQRITRLEDDLVGRRITIISDPLLSDHGPTRPVTLLTKALKEKRFRIRIVTPKVSLSLISELEELRTEVVSLDVKTVSRSETSILLETWMREIALRSRPREITDFGELILNFSSTICAASHVWYVQGPVLITVTVDSVFDEMPWRYKIPYKLLRPLVERLDFKFVNMTANGSRWIYANSGYTATLFKSLGLRSGDVIFPPVDTDKFKPTTETPSEDYALTYFGKETKYATIVKLADNGVKIKAFGGKMPPFSKDALVHPNIEFLGTINDRQLAALYSNALFTIFPFTNEPFGYVPVESMSCGTPTLSFNRQGPAETIVDGKTGWLVKSDSDMVECGKRLWKQKYDPKMRGSCRKHAKKNFDQAVFVDKFLVILQNVQQME